MAAELCTSADIIFHTSGAEKRISHMPQLSPYIDLLGNTLSSGALEPILAALNASEQFHRAWFLVQSSRRLFVGGLGMEHKLADTAGVHLVTNVEAQIAQRHVQQAFDKDTRPHVLRMLNGETPIHRGNLGKALHIFHDIRQDIKDYWSHNSPHRLRPLTEMSLRSAIEASVPHENRVVFQLQGPTLTQQITVPIFTSPTRVQQVNSDWLEGAAWFEALSRYGHPLVAFFERHPLGRTIFFPRNQFQPPLGSPRDRLYWNLVTATIMRDILPIAPDAVDTYIEGPGAQLNTFRFGNASLTPLYSADGSARPSSFLPRTFSHIGQN